MRYIAKVIVLSFLCSIVFFQSKECFPALKEEYWLIKKSTHFILYYKSQITSDYLDQILTEAEKNYEQITENLGFRRFEFWTWDRRCKIYLFPSAKEYYNDTGRPGWSAAHVNFQERSIKTFLSEEDFFAKILPHEMAHLIFREFIGNNTSLPLWLDEGIATLEERSGKEERLTVMKGLAKGNLLIHLDKLTNIKAGNLVMPNLFYTHAASVVYFLLQQYGSEKFVAYCRDLRDRRDWEGSLERIYGFSNMVEMDEKWVEFLIKIN